MSTVEAVMTLHTSSIDMLRAYEKAQEETEDQALRAFFRGMIDLKQRAHDELHTILAQIGEAPDEDGSFMSTVHKTVIAVRSAIKGIDRSALKAFADGEESTIKQYDEAIAQPDMKVETSQILQAQKTALLGKIAEMKTMAR